MKFKLKALEKEIDLHPAIIAEYSEANSEEYFKTSFDKNKGIYLFKLILPNSDFLEKKFNNSLERETAKILMSGCSEFHACRYSGNLHEFYDSMQESRKYFGADIKIFDFLTEKYVDEFDAMQKEILDSKHGLKQLSSDKEDKLIVGAGYIACFKKNTPEILIGQVFNKMFQL